MRMNGQRLVVLGGSSGIGLATAQAAAAEGADIVLVSSNQQRIAAALATLPKGGTGHAVNLRDETEIGALFHRIGAFDHLVYTAGENLTLGTLAETPIDQARQFLDLRLWGALTAVKYATPHLRPGGSITLTTGIANRRPRSGWVMAAAVCGAMDGVTRALAMELAPIRINAVSPGLIKTALWDSMSEMDRAALYRDVGGSLSVGRIGEAAEVAQTFLYLMNNGFATGQVVVLDGGAVLV
ncbi:MAG: SDR family oxidoreductase [Dongiaceae bacterium]